MHTRRIIVSAGTALAIIAATDVAAREPIATSAATATVTLKNIAFHPAKVSIARGSSVRWVWRDGSTIHNVTFKRFHSKTMNRGTFTHRFTRSGTFRYRCTIHPGMTSTVVVR